MKQPLNNFTFSEWAARVLWGLSPQERGGVCRWRSGVSTLPNVPYPLSGARLLSGLQLEGGLVRSHSILAALSSDEKAISNRLASNATPEVS